jgi:hypothetical protein
MLDLYSPKFTLSRFASILFIYKLLLMIQVLINNSPDYLEGEGLVIIDVVD